MSGAILVDLDGTLAEYHGWKGGDVIGPPVPLMLARVQHWIKQGKTVKIFTARASDKSQIPAVQKWLEENGIGGLEVTNVKDFTAIEIWDDRAITVEHNTGRILTK